MNFLNGLQNFLQFINDNWTSIIVIIGLILTIFRKIKNYSSKSTGEKVDIVKKQITETMLKMITDAEMDYEYWNKAGSIKRSQVIEKIFKDYPILSKVTNQEEIIQFISNAIDNSLKELRKTIEKNEVKNEIEPATLILEQKKTE